MTLSLNGVCCVTAVFLLPFGSFRYTGILVWEKGKEKREPFYSLLGVSGKMWYDFVAINSSTVLSTPFWEFLVCVLFEIFLSFSLKVFMKLIRTFVISSQNLALVF